eukprot:TRINITY_DN620_c0_g2_i2.p1 TRINITY_DN620_c0_g2~~TRINITY_DN620_c0_g2_i2.p1  ORF type:complete len:796 (+),score=110.98 TRINITY_DN620_c0_g2_i2:173-2560(+)
MSCTGTYEVDPFQNPASLSEELCSDVLEDYADVIIPKLSLHMLHGGTSRSQQCSMPTPLSMQAIKNLATQPSGGAPGGSVTDCELAVGVAARFAGCKQPTGMATEVTLGKRSICVSTPSHEVEIPLALSEVCYKEFDSGYSVICVIVSSENCDALRGEEGKQRLSSELHVDPSCAGATRHNPDKVVWMFNASGSQSAMDNLLGVWSTLGVIRSDFLESVEVSSKSLGEGGCSMVYLGKSRSAGSSGPIAVKILTVDGKDAEAMIRREVRFMLAVQGYPGCIGFKGVYKHAAGSSGGDVPALDGGSSGDQDVHCIRWAMVMEYYPKGDLYSFVGDQGRLREAQAKPIIQGVLSALSYIHQLGIVHRDVKPENIFMASDFRTVLADFGIAVHVDDTMGLKLRTGSPGYMAPELIRGLPYGTSSDVFSAGASLFFMLAGSLAFNARTAEKILRKNRDCKVNFQMSFWRALSVGTAFFLRMLLVADPKRRPEAAKALEWLGLDESQLQKEDLSGQKLHQRAQETSSCWINNTTKDTRNDMPPLAEASPMLQSQDPADTAPSKFLIKAPALPKTRAAPQHQRFLKRPSDPKASAQKVSECVSPDLAHPEPVRMHNRSGDPHPGQSSSSENRVSSRIPEGHLSVRPDSPDVHASRSSRTYQPARSESAKQTCPAHRGSDDCAQRTDHVLPNFSDEPQAMSNESLSADFSEDSFTSSTELARGLGQAGSSGELMSNRRSSTSSLHARSRRLLPDIRESLKEDDEEKEQAEGEQMDDEEQDGRGRMMQARPQIHRAPHSRTAG